MMSELISYLNPVLSSLYYPQRIMVMAVFGEVLILSILLLFYVCSCLLFSKLLLF